MSTLVLGPSSHSHNQNYHPANKYAQFLVEETGREVSFCPFVELIELCGEMAEIDVLELGKKDDHFCGTATGAYPHEPGSVFMACQKVGLELATRLAKLTEQPVTDEELARLREMTAAERQSVINRLNYADERKELLAPIRRTYKKQFPKRSAEAEVVAWAHEQLSDLQAKAIGENLWTVTCPQAPESPGPMIRY